LLPVQDRLAPALADYDLRADHTQNQHDDGNDQQNVNEAAIVALLTSPAPQHDKDDCDCPQHLIPFLTAHPPPQCLQYQPQWDSLV